MARLSYTCPRLSAAAVCRALAALVALWVGACSDSDPPDETTEITESEPYTWSMIADATGAALLSVHGTSARDVYAVGADDGTGPLALHWDGARWERLETGYRGDLWWVHAVGGVVYMAGSDSHILRYAGGAFERMRTPGLGKHTIFGLWGSSATDLYAVGSVAGRNGFIWHYDGSAWSDVALPAEIPLDDNRDTPQFFKVWGHSPGDVCVVGEEGVVLRGNAAEGFRLLTSPSDALLFTVHGVGERFVAVGGGDNGVALEVGEQVAVDTSPSGAPGLLQGVWIADSGEVWATGASGSIYRQKPGAAFVREETGIATSIASLHAVWVDQDGGVWAVGGGVLTAELDKGVALYGHPTASAPAAVTVPAPDGSTATTCPEAGVDPEPSGSIARRWNEQLLGAVRRDVPRPTVHARNLFHVSAALWDVWAAYDETAVGYLVDEQLSEGGDAVLEEAMSYAAYRVLSHRYRTAVGGEVSQNCFNAFMARLGYDPSMVDTEGDSPRAFGNRVGQAYIEAFADDGANEQMNYADPEGFVIDTPRIVVDEPGSNTDDPTRWQQLVLAEAVTQNGIPEGSGVRDYIGAHWRMVTPFALERPSPGAPYFDVEAPTTLDDDLVDATVEVLRRTAGLDIEDGVLIDISPGAIGNNPLGTNDGTGYPTNPVTNTSYAPNMVLRGDFARVLAEFWADGPSSETPPGHWNTVANDVADSPGFELRLFGEGAPLPRLSWDVHMYLALNGALHDAAIVAWELKRAHLTARPITLIRTMGGLGQRTDPSGPSYHPNGLPLEPGLIEVITADSSAPGQRHAHLARYMGEIAVFSWRGEPGDRKTEVGGIGWIRAVDWVPYQRRTFVTPEFPAFISGHSTFSRSGAEVLTRLTASPYFPGGLGGYTLEPGLLFFEFGPSKAVQLQWATYYDAADQAGQSRLWGGIHVRQDDFQGRILGSTIGEQAVAKASRFFNGTGR